MQNIESVEITLPDDNTVTLDSPITRGKTTIDSLTLRKPQSGELRGLQLVELLNMDVGTLIKLLPHPRRREWIRRTFWRAAARSPVFCCRSR